MPKDYYMVLGINRDVDPDKIKRAYREVAKKYHPDTAPSKEGAERFLEIREAYETLSDEKRRKEYDRQLVRGGPQGGDRLARGSRARPSPTRAREKPFPFYPNDLDSVFPFDASGFSWPGLGEKDIFYEAILSPEEAREGGTFSLEITVEEPCPTCSRMRYGGDLPCRLCSRTGLIRTAREMPLSIPPGLDTGPV
ncbi:MAG: DnaJ domain-containing protein [Deltaproteobacteria bacterium]|nr:DnaJ domain-containing protein [Deltaproteobacteria bacterium]MBW2137365.1 DnaJ domain-containing protein [Deltaproteobacteria bacterium]